MTLERTLSIIKPDAVAKNVIGEIYTRFEKGGLRIVAAKMLCLTREQAAAFYAVHSQRTFYQELIAFMTSGPVLVQVLEGENAVQCNRDLMGATFPKNAMPGTIRAEFCDVNGDQGENAVHGSDSSENAANEIKFFFQPEEICARTR